MCICEDMLVSSFSMNNTEQTMIFTQKGLIRQSGSHLVMEYDLKKKQTQILVCQMKIQERNPTMLSGAV